MIFEFISTFILGALLYVYFIYKGRPPAYWSKHGIPFIDSQKVATNMELLLGGKTVTHRDDYAYKVMGNSRFCGMLETPKPVILIKDLEIVKKVTIKDFEHFVDRREFFHISKKDSILAKVLGFLRGDEWRSVRSFLSPTFTTGKIRRMMEHFNGVSLEWTDMLKSKAKASLDNTAVVDIGKEANLYLAEVIGSSVFGMKPGVIKNPESVFAKMANRISYMGLWEFMKMNLSQRYPKMFDVLGVEVFDTTAINFFEEIMRQSLEERKKGISKNDFQQLMIDARKGALKATGSDDLSKFEKEAQLGSWSHKGQYMTDDIIIAQGVVFFLAGFLTTSTFISFALYALALHQDCQEKLRKEVETVVKEDGSLDYDELGHLSYLDMIVCEVLRHFPGATRLERDCVKDYHDPESGLVVKKDAVVVVPVHAIHHDPQYYEQPNNFYPEHFTPEQKAKRSPYAFLAFGLGVRNCIGMRFALVESKAAIAHLVHRFKIDPTESTPSPLQGVFAGQLIFTPKDLKLRLTPRE